MQKNQKGLTMELRPSAKAFKENVGDTKPVTILEVGIYRGHNAKELYKNFNCKTLYLMDKWYTHYDQYHVPEILDYAKKAMSFFDGCDNVIFIKADSIKFQLWPKNYFDYIYLDGDHSYEHCKVEFPMYWDLLKDGGLLSGDNLEAAGVRQALIDLCKSKNLSHESAPWKKDDKTGRVISSDWWIWKK